MVTMPGNETLPFADAQRVMTTKFPKFEGNFAALFNKLENEPYYGVSCSVLSELTVDKCKELCVECGLPDIMASRLGEMLKITFKPSCRLLGSSLPEEPRGGSVDVSIKKFPKAKFASDDEVRCTVLAFRDCAHPHA